MFVGKGKNKHLFMTCSVVGTMCSGKADTGDMNSIRSKCYVDYHMKVANITKY